MIEYFPWSKQILSDTLASQKSGNIPTLDIELTAKCTGASCVYCDSKPNVCGSEQIGEIDFNTMKKVICDAKSRGLKWIYTCGLGEPLEDSKFWNMIHLLKANDIGISIFSNGIFIRDVNTAYELKECNVNIILKMDTFNEENFDTILGGVGIASKVYAACEYLLRAGYGERNGYTNLAFSIVPTTLSISGIPMVVNFAKKHGIFASIGELEQAGEVINNNLNETLGISAEKIKELKKVADDYIEGSYMRPMCPCILTGLHIDNLGNCIVDEDTGLNCKWFLLKDPRTIKLGNIMNESIFSLSEKAYLYRKECFEKKLDLIKTSCNLSYTFGGCGGNPKDILKLAIENI